MIFAILLQYKSFLIRKANLQNEGISFLRLALTRELLPKRRMFIYIMKVNACYTEDICHIHDNGKLNAAASINQSFVCGAVGGIAFLINSYNY